MEKENNREIYVQREKKGKIISFAVYAAVFFGAFALAVYGKNIFLFAAAPLMLFSAWGMFGCLRRIFNSSPGAVVNEEGFETDNGFASWEHVQNITLSKNKRNENVRVITVYIKSGAQIKLGRNIFVGSREISKQANKDKKLLTGMEVLSSVNLKTDFDALYEAMKNHHGQYIN